MQVLCRTIVDYNTVVPPKTHFETCYTQANTFIFLHPSWGDLQVQKVSFYLFECSDDI